MLELAIGDRKIESWKHSKTHGLILCWGNYNDNIPFPSELTTDEISFIVWAYRNSSEADGVQLKGWDIDCDQDGFNTKGWRVYVEDWNMVDGNDYAVVATPAYLWFGK